MGFYVKESSSTYDGEEIRYNQSTINITLTPVYAIQSKIAKYETWQNPSLVDTLNLKRSTKFKVVTFRSIFIRYIYNNPVKV